MSAPHRMFTLVIAVLLVVGNRTAAEQPSFTLEQVMSAPFAAHLTVSPTAGKVAWVINERGVRNVWAAEPPDYKARKLTSYTQDDGLEIYDLEWTPDARRLLFVRGGDEDGGENPNPQSKIKQPEQSIWQIVLDKRVSLRLSQGHSPRISPAGDRFAFINKDQVQWQGLSALGSEQLFEARGRCADLRWSPDGGKLAFVSLRKEHSLIGVYDWAAKTLHWLDPSIDRDSDPAWSPDGKQVAFLRQPAGRSVIFGPKREGEPWSIRVAEVSSGKGRQVWRAEKGTGSVFRGVVASNQLFWAAGDRIVFPWERDDWTHLYSVPCHGGSAVLLTPGSFEVEYVSLSPDRHSMIFNSNQDDIDRRHVWTVPVSGGLAKALTKGKALEWQPALTSDGKAAVFFRADGRRPGRAMIQVGSSAARDLAPASRPADFPESKLADPELVMLSGADGLPLHGQLFRRRESAKGERRPAVIFFHGGSRRQMLLGWHYMRYYHNAYAFNQFLAAQGCIVLSVNYRSGIGYGMKFREAEHYGARGASEFQDVQGAGFYLRNRPDVDGARIALWGGSYGGYLTALGLARAPELFAAGVDIHGVYDWNNEIRNWEPTYDPRSQGEAARVAFESSPIASVKSWRAPVLVIHGDDDRNVPFNETIHLVEDLRKRNVIVEQLIFPDEIHDFLTHEHWVHALRASAEFLERQLKRKEVVK